MLVNDSLCTDNQAEFSTAHVIKCGRVKLPVICSWPSMFTLSLVYTIKPTDILSNWLLVFDESC